MIGGKVIRDTREYSYCPSTGKRSFSTRGEAMVVVREFQLKHKGNPTVYRCSECGQFHTTSMSYQLSKDIDQGGRRGSARPYRRPHPKWFRTNHL